VRKEARMKFRIWIQLGCGGRIVACVVNGPKQNEVPSFGRRVGRDCL
jgi:hypothetical protein